jgi:hypothetical protein
MSSDRLSFNQNADNEDGGARWEAYLALQRRNAGPPTANVDEESEEPALGDPPDWLAAREAGSVAENDQVEETDHREAEEPLSLYAASAALDPDADNDAMDGLGPLQRSAVTPPHGSSMIAAILALGAGFALAMALGYYQQLPRDATLTRPPAPQAAKEAPAREAAATPLSATPVAAEAPVSKKQTRTPTVTRTVLPPLLAPAHAPRRHQHLRRLASAARACRGCRSQAPPQPRHLEPQPRRQEPQCWTPVPSLDYAHTEMRLADCPPYVPPVGSAESTWPWQARPQAAAAPADDSER